MKLSPEQELSFRAKIKNIYGIPLEGYDDVIFGLGNELFASAKPDYLANKDILDHLIQMDYTLWMGEKHQENGKTKKILYCPTRYSAPVANTMFELYLCHSDAKRAVGVGYAGSLQEDIEIGDIIIPNYAERGEGVSYYYAPGERFPPVSEYSELEDSFGLSAALPSKDLTDLMIENAEDEDIIVHIGRIYTTDCFHMETEAFIDKLHELGYLGIEMELATLFTVAQWHEKEATGIVVVSDRPYPVYPDFTLEIPPKARENLQTAIRIATKSLLETE